MPWRPIQAQANGLLSLLGLKNRGSNPELLSELVQPTVDLREWYLSSNIVNLGGDLTMDGPPGSSIQWTGWDPGSSTGETGIVPTGEMWYVWSYSINIPQAAGNVVVQPLLSYLTPDNNLQFLEVSPYVSTFFATLDVSVDVVAQPRRWFMPGTRFGAGVGHFNFVGDTVTTNVYLEVTKVPF